MIRKAENKDLNELAELFSQLHEYHCGIFPDAHKMPKDKDFFLKEMSELLNDEEKLLFVNDDGGSINAYALLYFFDDVYDLKPFCRVCHIDHFAVRKDCRHSGVGTALFKHICEYAKQNGCMQIRLGVNAVNENAVRFYEKMGLSPRTVTMTKKL